MDHREFHEAVVEIANGRHCCTQVTAYTSSTGRISVRWQAYIQREHVNGWTDEHASPEEALAQLRGETKPEPETRLEDIGAAPEATAGVEAAVG